MNYILMHKNVPVVEMDIDESRGIIRDLGEVMEKEHAPISTIDKNGNISLGFLVDWWRGRAIPASRQHIQEMLVELEMKTPGELVTKAFGLSLSDQYWVNPLNNSVKWKDVNFFHNEFSEDLGKHLLGELSGSKDMNMIAPDNTSDGWLGKRWKIKDKIRVLRKGGSKPFYQEPFNEAFASRLMKHLGVRAVSYTVDYMSEKCFSECANFITDNTELVTAYYISAIKKKSNNVSDYEHFIACCEELGVENVRADLDKLITIDYLLVNTDRHWTNFGAIRNADTLKWLHMSPVYDTGTSLWCDLDMDEISRDKNYKSKMFRSTHEGQLKLVKDFSWLSVDKLRDTTDIFNEVLKESGEFYDKKRMDLICRKLGQRVDDLVNVITKVEN